MRKIEAPSSQSKNKEKIREIETIQTNESYHTIFQSNLRCPDPPGIERAGFFLKTSNLSFLAAKKSKKSVLRKGLVARFSQDVQFELFGRQKVQKERLEKRFGGSIPGGSWKRFSYPSVLNLFRLIYTHFPGLARSRATKPFLKTLFLDFLGAKKLKLDVLRKSSHQTFSQDALFGLFGRQTTQIGRLDKKKRTKLWLLRRGRLESRSGHSRRDCTFFGEFCV